MPRMENKAIPEGNGSAPQQEEYGSGKPTLANLYRLFEERFDRQMKIVKSCFEKMDEISENWRSMDQCLTRLEHDAQQPRLAMQAGGPSNTKTRERTESATTQQFKQSTGIAVLPTRLISTRCVLPASEMTAPDRRPPLVQGRMPW